MAYDFGGQPWQSRPRGKYWLPKEFHGWPDVEAAGLSAIGLFIQSGVWAAAFDTDLITRKHVRQYRDLADRLVDVGLWLADGKDYRARQMADLRAGRGKPGLIMRLDRLVYDAVFQHGAGPTGLWALAARWSLNTDTPGFVPTEVARQLGTAKLVGRLWESGLWLLSERGFRMSYGDGIYRRWALARDDERPDIPAALRQAIYARDGHRCLGCGSVEGLTLDHIVPWSWGGPDTEENLRVLCRPCNSSKGARLE